MKRISVRFELNGDGTESRHYSLGLWLAYRDAVPVRETEWVLITPLTAEEVRCQLQTLIGPGDLLEVTHAGAMSVRIPIGTPKSGLG